MKIINPKFQIFILTFDKLPHIFGFTLEVYIRKKSKILVLTTTFEPDSVEVLRYYQGTQVRDRTNRGKHYDNSEISKTYYDKA